MNKKPDISTLQLALMATGSALVFPYTFLPILNSPPANQDVWAAFLLAFVYILVLNAPLLYLMNKYRGVKVSKAVELTMGKLFGKILLIPLIAFFIYCYTACMLITAIFIELYLMPRTPTWALLIFMVLPVIYATYKGAGTIARLATFLVPIALFVVVFFFIIGLANIDITMLEPVLVNSAFAELNLGAFFTAARYSEILIFFVFSFYLAKKHSINKTYAGALVTFGLGFLMILLPTILVLGMDYAKMAWNPYYTFTRQLEAFGFIERVHAFNMLAWFPMAILKLTLYSYMACEVLSGVVKAKSHRPFVLPVSIIAYIACLMPFMNKSSTVEKLRSDEVFPYIIVPIIFVIPVLILIVYLIRKKKVDQGLDKIRAAGKEPPN